MPDASSPPPESRMTTAEFCGYIAGLLPWRRIGAVLCFAGLVATGFSALNANEVPNNPGTNHYSTRKDGITCLAAAVAFGWGFQTLMRRENTGG